MHLCLEPIQCLLSFTQGLVSLGVPLCMVIALTAHAFRRPVYTDAASLKILLKVAARSWFS